MRFFVSARERLTLILPVSIPMSEFTSELDCVEMNSVRPARGTNDGVLSGKRWSFGNLDGYVKGMEGVKSLAQWIGSQFDETLSWKDVEWIRGLWPGKLIIKGILDAEDAKRAAGTGVSALVVSNHGGRQLDGTASSISMLPKIADAVGSEIEVMFDGGIRTGQDVFRA